MKWTTSGKFLAIAAAIALNCWAAHASAGTIAQWTFETSIPTTAGPFAPEVGSGAALGSAGPSAVYSNPVGPGSAESFSANNWTVDGYWQFSTSTLGYDDIKVSFDAMGSNTGPKDFKIAWSTDNSTYTDFGNYALINASWSSQPTFVNPPAAHFDFDFSSVAALENQPAVYFRLIDTGTVSINGGTVATSGTSRVDNFTISGVPEPTSLALLGLASVACVGVIRRRS
jgi:hypothetical protein